MANQIRLWKINGDSELGEVRGVPLDLECRLQEWLARDIAILDSGLLVIGREVPTDFGGYIDLLCVDAVGDLVVVELKRDKTPREITAQVLDYASWVVGLSHERVSSIADGYLREGGFEAAFRQKFETDLPETLNGDHRLLVVGSLIDAGSERIIRYLSDVHGVNINAATFQHFRADDGGAFLARVFLIEPAEVASQVRQKSAAKRQPNLSYEELAARADECGVGELYQYAALRFGRVLQRRATRTSVGFESSLDGGRRTVFSLLPGDSSAGDGLRYQLYRDRFCAVAGISSECLTRLLPASHTSWAYPAGGGGADYQGYHGYLVSTDEVDRLAAALEQGRAASPSCAAS